MKPIQLFGRLLRLFVEFRLAPAPRREFFGNRRNLAELFTTWAWYLECSQAYKKAESVFSKGVDAMVERKLHREADLTERAVEEMIAETLERRRQNLSTLDHLPEPFLAAPG